MQAWKRRMAFVLAVAAGSAGLMMSGAGAQTPPPTSIPDFTFPSIPDFTFPTFTIPPPTMPPPTGPPPTMPPPTSPTSTTPPPTMPPPTSPTSTTPPPTMPPPTSPPVSFPSIDDFQSALDDLVRQFIEAFSDDPVLQEIVEEVFFDFFN